MSHCVAMKRKFGFVLPRYVPGLAGGAETLSASLGTHLAARGDCVEILTTCARDNRTWENELPAGEEWEAGMQVRRFPVDDRDLEVWVPRQIQISEGMRLDIEDQLLWMEHSVNSSALYAHLQEHAHEFDALFFAPYLFGTTFWGALIAPEQSYLIPCLHDEHYAYLEIIQSLFRQVSGMLFNAHPEQELAQALYGPLRGGVVGMGFESYEQIYVEQLRPYFETEFPYLLYFGRKETGKNVHVLVDYFCALKESGSVPENLKLVIFGGGSFDDLHRPGAREREDVIDLGHMSQADKERLIRHALVVCQPSENESFSIVLMEAWLLGTPVLVSANCPVTKDHVLRSGGGLYFGNEEDFAGVMCELLRTPELRQSLAIAGRRYVEKEYSWSAVMERFDRVMGEFLTLRLETGRESRL